MLRYLYFNQKGKLILFIVFSLLSSLFEIALSYVMLQSIDLAMSGKLSDALNYGLWFGLYIFCYFFVDLVCRRLRWSVLRGSQSHLRDDLMSRILGQSIPEFHTQNTSHWLSILTNDLDLLDETYFRVFMDTLVDIFSGIVSLVVLLFISPWLVLFIFAMIAIQMLIPKVMAPRISKRRAEQSKSAERFTATANEHLEGFDLLRSFHLTEASREAMSKANQSWEESKFQARYFGSLARLLSFTVGQIIYIGIYFIGAILTLQGLMTVGMMVAASQLVVYIANPIQNVSDAITDMRGAEEIIKKFRALLDKRSAVEDGTKDIPQRFSNLTVDHVSYSYDKERPILSDVCLSLEHGGKYLLEGDSGSGKTTLIQLLTDAMKPDAGRILLDGQPIERYKAEQYARFIIPCSQQTFIFNASIRDNITLFCKDFTDDAVIAALKKSGFEEILTRYSDGLDHKIDQSGSSLSGGERQRLALARIFLFEPQIVIYDESFAHLDAASVESLIDAVMEDTDRTVIMTSHQVTPEIRNRFQSLVLKDGSVQTAVSASALASFWDELGDRTYKEAISEWKMRDYEALD